MKNSPTTVFGQSDVSNLITVGAGILRFALLLSVVIKILCWGALWWIDSGVMKSTAGTFVSKSKCWVFGGIGGIIICGAVGWKLGHKMARCKASAGE